MIFHLHLARGFAVGPVNIAAANIGEIGINLSTVYTREENKTGDSRVQPIRHSAHRHFVLMSSVTNSIKRSLSLSLFLGTLVR